MPAFGLAAPRISNLTADGAVNNPYGMTIGPDGGLYICEIGNHRISRFDFATGKLMVVVDNQKEPYEVRFDRGGMLYFVDMPAHQVKRVDGNGVVSVVAGTGVPGFSGDGGPAASAMLKQPHSIAFDPGGQLLICDIGNHRIRRVDPGSGVISTWAGNGEKTITPEGARRQNTPLWGPRALDFDGKGDLIVVLREGNAVLRYDAKKDQYHRVAEKLSGPKGVSCAPDRSIYIADTESHTIRRIDQDGVITKVAGTGERGDGPVGDPLGCRLSRPHGVLAGKRGEVYIADSEAHRVRVLR